MMLPSFNERGNLPPGIHSATWDEVEDRFGVVSIDLESLK